jgi:hypothetical protein
VTFALANLEVLKGLTEAKGKARDSIGPVQTDEPTIRLSRTNR